MGDSEQFSEDQKQSNLARERFKKLLLFLANKGISQQNVALRLGVSPAYVTDVKTGRRSVSELFARKLGEKFGVDHNWVLGILYGEEISASNLAASSSVASHRIWLPVFLHPIRGEPRTIPSWSGAMIELVGAAAIKAMDADKPYVLSFGAHDRHGLLRKNDQILVSQAINPVAELQVIKQSSKIFLARHIHYQWWEPVNSKRTMDDQSVTIAGHALGIVWRSL